MLPALATIIRRRRLEQNLSLEKFAKLLGVTLEFLSDLESGEIDIQVSELYEIAASLNTSCGELTEQAELLTEAKEFRQYRMRRKLTTLKQISTLQRQQRSLKNQLERIEQQRKNLIASDQAAYPSAHDRRFVLQAMEKRLTLVKQLQEEQDRFMLRYLANRETHARNIVTPYLVARG